MGNTLRNTVIALVVFNMLFALFNGIYVGFSTEYGFTDELTNSDGYTMSETINNLLIIESIENIKSAMEGLSTPTGSLADIFGAIKAGALGVIGAIMSIFVVPGQIITAIIGGNGFYKFPEALVWGISTIALLYLLFAVLKKHLGDET